MFLFFLKKIFKTILEVSQTEILFNFFYKCFLFFLKKIFKLSLKYSITAAAAATTTTIIFFKKIITIEENLYI